MKTIFLLSSLLIGQQANAAGGALLGQVIKSFGSQGPTPTLLASSIAGGLFGCLIGRAAKTSDTKDQAKLGTKIGLTLGGVTGSAVGFLGPMDVKFFHRFIPGTIGIAAGLGGAVVGTPLCYGSTYTKDMINPDVNEVFPED